MSGIVLILMIFWLASAFTSANKQAKKQAKQKGAAPRAAAQPKQKPAPKQAAAKPAAAKVDPLWSRRDAQQTRIPSTKEEWKAYINEMSKGLAPEKASPRPAAPTHSEFSGEGSFSTQGESAEEHAKHRRRIEREEAQHRQERDALDDLRAANRDRLRAAVVMSEVLGKPLSLRPRTGYHR